MIIYLIGFFDEKFAILIETFLEIIYTFNSTLNSTFNSKRLPMSRLCFVKGERRQTPTLVRQTIEVETCPMFG